MANSLLSAGLVGAALILGACVSQSHPQPTATPADPTLLAAPLVEIEGLSESEMERLPLGAPLWMLDLVVSLESEGLVIDFEDVDGLGEGRVAFPLCAFNYLAGLMFSVRNETEARSTIIVWAYPDESSVAAEWIVGADGALVFTQECEPGASVTRAFVGAVYQQKNLVMAFVEAVPYAPPPLLRSAALDEQILLVLRSLEEHDASLAP